MPSEFARNLAQTLEREARVRVGPPTRRGATPRRELLATVRREVRVDPPTRELATVRDKEVVLGKR